MTQSRSPASDVAVLGAGIMGSGMARSLLRQGFRVRVWNRTMQRAEALTADGAVLARSASEAVDGADFVITMLQDADAVISVLSGAADAIGASSIWVQSSTVGLLGCDRVAQFAAASHIDVLDAPVLGTKHPAEQGRLVVLTSGEPELIRRTQPLFNAIGRRTVVAGTKVGQASALKLVCNAWVLAITVAVGQSIAFADALGLDPTLFLNSQQGAPTDSPFLHLKGAQMMEDDFTTSFAVDGVLKDVGLLLEAGRSIGVRTEFLEAVRGLYTRASDAGRGGEDMAAVVTALRPDR